MVRSICPSQPSLHSIFTFKKRLHFTPCESIVTCEGCIPQIAQPPIHDTCLALNDACRRGASERFHIVVERDKSIEMSEQVSIGLAGVHILHLKLSFFTHITHRPPCDKARIAVQITKWITHLIYEPKIELELSSQPR
jgi:hypothetical protein